ncbi:MAG: cysteine--tRNA ligase [Pseudomonadota bacterium]
MTLTIYNTLTRQKEVFTPLNENQVRMYVCGMTVYDFCHLGHARVMVAFDVINRYLRSRGYDVTYVRNVTDIDDKIINRATESGEAWTALTARFIDAMHEDELRLQNQLPDQEPLATEHVDDILNMVQALIDNDSAYAVDGGDVYFRINSFKDYGKLSNKRLEDLQSGARVDVSSAKEDPRDFVLWKRAKPGEPSWASPWGEGRPGWHIECSAMSTCCLGNSFDIHGGGPDLVFPHHENEIAQSEMATGESYANYWMHAGAVRVDNEKMSKSLGNFFTIRDILDQYHPEVVRYFLIASHYRSPINYTAESLQEAKKALTRMYTSIRAYDDVVPLSLRELSGRAAFERFNAVMDDDFNTREALSVLFDLVSQINSADEQDADTQATARQCVAELKGIASVLGLLQHSAQAFFQGSAREDGLDDAAIDALIAERQQAKLDKNYARADEVREQLRDAGIVLEDAGNQCTWRRE